MASVKKLRIAEIIPIKIKGYEKWYSFMISADDVEDFDEFIESTELRFNKDADISAEAVSEDMYIISVDPKKTAKITMVRNYLQNTKEQGALESFSEEWDFVVTEKNVNDLYEFNQEAYKAIGGNGVDVTYNGENVTIGIDPKQNSKIKEVENWLNSIKG